MRQNVLIFTFLSLLLGTLITPFLLISCSDHDDNGEAEPTSTPTPTPTPITFMSAYGGINSDEGKAIQQTEDGGYIICGETNSFGEGSNVIYLVKIDEKGQET